MDSFLLGAEGAGTVAAVGPGVTEVEASSLNRADSVMKAVGSVHDSISFVPSPGPSSSIAKEECYIA